MAKTHGALGFVEGYEIVKILTLTSKLLKEGFGKETLPGSMSPNDDQGAATIQVDNYY